MNYTRDNAEPGIHRPRYMEMSDADLIAACRRSDKQAFEHLMKRYSLPINAWIFQLVPDWQDRSDLRQEVLIKVWRAIVSLRTPEAFRTWLRRLVTNLVYDELKVEQRFRSVSMDGPMKEDTKQSFERQIADNSSVPDTIYERHELASCIRSAIAKLPADFRIAFVLREMGDMTYGEIAERTRTSLGTVKSRVSRARRKIQSFMQSYMKAI